MKLSRICRNHPFIHRPSLTTMRTKKNYRPQKLKKKNRNKLRSERQRAFRGDGNRDYSIRRDSSVVPELSLRLSKRNKTQSQQRLIKLQATCLIRCYETDRECLAAQMPTDDNAKRKGGVISKNERGSNRYYGRKKTKVLVICVGYAQLVCDVHPTCISYD